MKYKKMIDKYIEEFENLTGLEFDGFVGEDYYTNVLMFSDYWVEFFTLTYVIENKVPTNFFFDWYEMEKENNLALSKYCTIRNIFTEPENKGLFEIHLKEVLKEEKKTDLKRIKSKIAEAKAELIKCIKK